MVSFRLSLLLNLLSDLCVSMFLFVFSECSVESEFSSCFYFVFLFF